MSGSQKDSPLWGKAESARRSGVAADTRDADLLADLAGRVGTRATTRAEDESRRLERADRFRLVVWRVEALIAAGYPAEQAGELGRDTTVEVREAVELLGRGVAAADAAARLRGRQSGCR
ncbi:MAG TPA: hypothetical protein VIU86_20715 [Gaiellaceae bacterium]